MKIFITTSLCLVLLLSGCASTGSKEDASRPDTNKPRPDLDYKAPEKDLKPKTDQWLPVYTVPLYYPQKALDKGIQGYVLLEYTVTKDGSVRDIVVKDSSPLNYFEWSAIRAATGFRYPPKIVKGEPVDVPSVQYKVDFKLPRH